MSQRWDFGLKPSVKVSKLGFGVLRLRFGPQSYDLGCYAKIWAYDRSAGPEGANDLCLFDVVCKIWALRLRFGPQTRN